MDSTGEIIQPSPAPIPSIEGFCRFLVERNHSSWPPGEFDIAQSFSEYFDKTIPTGVGQWKPFLQGLGINISVQSLPAGLKGYYICFNGNRQIILADKEGFPGAKEHTLLHELREIVEFELRKLGRPTASGIQLEQRAEDFAGASRVIGTTKAWGGLLSQTANIESKLKQFIAIIGLIFIGLFFGASIILLPQLEDAADQRNRT